MPASSSGGGTTWATPAFVDHGPQPSRSWRSATAIVRSWCQRTGPVGFRRFVEEQGAHGDRAWAYDGVEEGADPRIGGQIPDCGEVEQVAAAIGAAAVAEGGSRTRNCPKAADLAGFEHAGDDGKAVSGEAVVQVGRRIEH